MIRSALIGSFLISLAAIPDEAEAYDMDCKVILCLAGGFPSGCGDAKSYMLRRLKKKKPPFGPCSMDDGGEYSVPVRFLSRDYPPRCLAWSYGGREGKQCIRRTQGRTDRIISISIPPDEYRPEPFIGEFVWYSTPYRDNSK